MSSKISPKERVWRIGIIVILILIVLVCVGLVIWCWIWGEREKYRNRDEKRRLRELDNGSIIPNLFQQEYLQ